MAIFDQTSCFIISGENLVSEPPLKVQEVVEKRRNTARAARGFQRVSAVPFTYRQQRLGLSTKSEDEQRELGFSPEQWLSQHNGAFVPHKLLLVLTHELERAPPSQRAGTAPPQHSRQRRDDILTTTKIT